MGANSSKEGSVVKARKPYTLTKQREKWTEVEHIKFVDALKLYGRAWQRIEEHVGTKTAVQIRSHAQKFFTKLEKEANMKGVPPGQAHDFEIPPARPKRKPNGPYPRKNGAGPLYPFVEAMDKKTSKSPCILFRGKQATDIENNAAWKIRGTKDDYEDGNGTKVLNLFQDAPSSSFNRFPPLEIHMKDNTTIQGSSMPFDVTKNTKGNISGQLERTCVDSQGIPVQKDMEDVQSDQRCTKNVPIDFMKRNGVGNVPATTGSDAIPSTSRMIKATQSFLGVLPNFSKLPSNPDDCQSLINTLSVSSRFIISTLLQNSAVYAAASVAASIDSSSSETLHGRIPSSTSPSMAAIAVTTVSAAAAWWATQGLLPNHPSPQTDFKLAPDDKKEERERTFRNSLVIGQKNADPESFEAPRLAHQAAAAWWAAQGLLPNYPSSQTDFKLALDDKKEERGGTFQNSLVFDQKNIDPEPSEAPRVQLPNFRSLTLPPSSDLNASRRGELMDHAKTNNFKPLSSYGIHDSDKARNKKMPGHSFRGSNAQSSNGVETNLVSRKNQDEKESDKGRLAFHALLAREIMPQSFALAQAEESVAMTEDKGKEAISESPAVNLNMKASTSEPTNLYYLEGFCVASSFKPYKRCSVEAEEKRTTGDDGTRKKKIRLEGETSI